MKLLSSSTSTSSESACWAAAANSSCQLYLTDAAGTVCAWSSAPSCEIQLRGVLNGWKLVGEIVLLELLLTLVYCMLCLIVACFVAQTLDKFEYVGTAPHPGGKDFEHHLFGCWTNMGTCCLGYCCPMALSARTQHKSGELEFWRSLTCTMLILSCTLFFSPSVFFLLGLRARFRLRAKYSLPRQPCKDCCILFFCSPCAMCQQAQHVDHVLAQLADRAKQERDAVKAEAVGVGAPHIGHMCSSETATTASTGYGLEMGKLV